METLKKTLKKDMKVKGTVKSLRDFGAFVDIEGIQALLPISEISRSRVDDIKKALTIGQEIEAVILNLDWSSERISLSMKALQANPWDDADKRYPVDSKHSGKVVRITDFGAFVSLEPGLDGLIHISELKGDDPRDDNPQNALSKGQSISVQINSIDLERKRISLKPASKAEADENMKKYMKNENDSETYNPFAALLKDKMEKSDKKKEIMDYPVPCIRGEPGLLIPILLQNLIQSFFCCFNRKSAAVIPADIDQSLSLFIASFKKSLRLPGPPVEIAKTACGR